MIKQSLEQKLEQKLTPQQIQMIKLLELPVLELEQRIKQELEDNPALENDSEEIFSEEPETTQDENKQEDQDNEEFSLEDYLNDDDEIPVYKLQVNNISKDDNYKEMPYLVIKTFQETLFEQFAMKNLSENEKVIANYLVGTLDEDGYIRRKNFQIANDIAFKENVEVTEEEIENTIKVLQELEPCGIGARNLKECLQIQIDKKIKDIIKKDTYSTEEYEKLVPKTIRLAKRVIKSYFNEITRKHYNKIMAKLGINKTELKKIQEFIITLNPRPGASYSDTKTVNHYTVIPDFIIEVEGDELVVMLNDNNSFNLKINDTFAGMIKKIKKQAESSSKEALHFIRQKIESARWFIEAVNQRQNTLLITINTIVDIQRTFFITGDETTIKPMILKDIAEKINMDISTVSRVISSKYVATPYGTYRLKYFFSETIQTDERRDDDASSREVKAILKELIDNENKQQPLIDTDIAEILNERGYQIARRTIAKYREQLDIPVARLRKELK